MNKSVKLAAIALAALSSGALGLTGCGQTRSPGLGERAGSTGIVNGTLVQDGDPVLRSTVGIAMRMAEGQGLCTGTLLSDKVLLTAAHCVEPEVLRTAVIFARSFDAASATTVRPGTVAVQHPLWGKNDPSGRGDIALLAFEGGLPEGFGPAEILPATEELQPGEEAIVTGYGVENGIFRSGSGILRRATMPLLGLYSPTELLADGSSQSICFGDSGGPSYVTRAGKLYLWGVASAVTNGACTGYGLHTVVESYVDWIHETMERLNRVTTEPAPVVPVTPAPAPAPVEAPAEAPRAS